MTAALISGLCFVFNVHYLLDRKSHYFLQNVMLPAIALFIMLASAARVTERCRYVAVHLSGYRSSSDIFLAPLERIDFLTCEFYSKASVSLPFVRLLLRFNEFIKLRPSFF